MIKSDSQLKRTQSQIEGFQSAMAENAKRTDMPEPVKRAVIESHQGMISKLQLEIRDYQEMKAGIIRIPALTSPLDLVAHLPKFRIALGLSQEQLADMVGASRKTINQQEEHEYQTATIDLIARVIEALGIRPEIFLHHSRINIQPPHEVKHQESVASNP